MKNQIKPPVWLFTILRILIGWHFLYEGLVKLFNPNWTSAPFLLESKWWFSGIFRALGSDPTLLNIVDFINIWGLILIGTGLFFGLFTRLASYSGAALLLLYYVAHPPFTGYMVYGPAEGNYIWVNKNLIELFILILMARIPENWHFSIDNLVDGWKDTIKKQRISTTAGSIEVPASDNPAFKELPLLDRRRVLKNLISLPLLGGFSYAVLKNFGYESYEEKELKINGLTSASVKVKNFAGLKELKAPSPKGKIGNLEVSRLICGGNLIAGYSHSRDLIYVSSLMKKYFTKEKVWETFRLCEACGVNSAIVRTATDTISIVNKYWKLGGKIQWLAQTYPKDDDVVKNTQWAIDSGASAVYIQGNIADRWVHSGRIDLFEKFFSYFQNKGIPLGVGAHDLEVVKAMEEHKFPVDFYMKTIHDKNYWSWQEDDPKKRINENRADNYWSRTPEDTAEFMESVDKPWIAFKILAAGAIRPSYGFRYAFEKGADFACVGMFDYHVVEDCNIMNETLADLGQRRRKFV